MGHHCDFLFVIRGLNKLDSIFIIIICVVVAYLIGSINTSIIVSHILKTGDIRSKGSGNAGTTNTMRTIGKRAAAFVLMGDMLKGILAVLIARWFTNSDASIATLLAALSVIIGHIYPLYFGFKGGKGVATALATVAMLQHGWIIAIIILAVAIPLIIITRYMSLSVLITITTYPIIVFIFEKGDVYYFIFSILLLILIYITHRKNIVRLIKGEENKLSWGGKHE